MPELTEVRAHAERLHAVVGARQLTALRPLSITALKTALPPPVGQELLSIGSRGKYLLFEFPSAAIAVHLMQGGRLRPEGNSASKKPRGGLARMVFGDVSLLLSEAGTEKRAGLWVLDEPARAELFGNLGPDVDSPDRNVVIEALVAGGGRLHNTLRDQSVIAGVGRRLANEICFAAKLSPFASAAKLTADQREALLSGIDSALEQSFDFERAQTEMVKSAARRARVHNRTGEQCVACGDEIRAVEYRSYTINYCPSCQTDGRVLADNTTSKFLK